MNILAICNWGNNRSRYIATYLERKGYATRFGGLDEKSHTRITQADVNWSNVLIFVQPQIQRLFLKRFRVNNQRIISLDVEDRIEILSPNKRKLTGEEWMKIQRKRVYPELENQIGKFLPL
jgi:predicted protein tyrosine phosphatase